MVDFPEIKTERLLLRQISEDDIEYIYKGLSDPEVIRYYEVSFKTREETREQMKWFADLEKNGTGNWWAVCSADNLFYGAGGLNGLSREHKKAEIGFWLLPDFWGKGIMKEGMDLILNYGFHTLDLHRIEGFVESRNSNCIKVMRKLGFELEGTMRDCEIKNGEFISLEIYAKFNS